MSIPVIAIVGRPNVGKSTFFNRILEKRKAIVDPEAGTTRDRIYGSAEWRGKRISFIDTGGYIPETSDIFNAAVREQAQFALEEADAVILMMDGRENITASDRYLVQMVRKSGKPSLLVVNKCDNMRQDEQIHIFHEFGIEPVIQMSALSGRNTGNVLDMVSQMIQLDKKDMGQSDEAELSLAIVGMPNVGKSSLVNALLQKEQTIVTPIAGTTRDSIDTRLKWYGKNVVLIDTAGLRRKSKIQSRLEFYSTIRTHRSIEQCHVALVMIDAEKGFGNQDRSIVDHVIQAGKGLMLIVNKWDLIVKDTMTTKRYRDSIVSQFPNLFDFPIVFISAKTRQRVSGIMETAFQVSNNYQRKISTNELNLFLEKAVHTHSVPAEKGKVIKIKFIKQVSTAPPLFACYSNYPKFIPTHYKRFMENQMRNAFEFSGVPIRLSFRKS